MPQNFLTQTKDGIIFSVKLVPNSSFSKIVDFNDEFVRIKIASPPIDNRANKELISFCSNLFNTNKSKIKKILIKNENFEEITQKLMFVLNSLHKTK